MQLRSLMAKGPKKMLWGKKHIDNIRYHKYDSIIRDPQSMYDWINGKYLQLIFVPDNDNNILIRILHKVIA